MNKAIRTVGILPLRETKIVWELIQINYPQGLCSSPTEEVIGYAQTERKAKNWVAQMNADCREGNVFGYSTIEQHMEFI